MDDQIVVVKPVPGADNPGWWQWFIWEDCTPTGRSGVIEGTLADALDAGEEALKS